MNTELLIHYLKYQREMGGDEIILPPEINGSALMRTLNSEAPSGTPYSNPEDGENRIADSDGVSTTSLVKMFDSQIEINRHTHKPSPDIKIPKQKPLPKIPNFATLQELTAYLKDGPLYDKNGKFYPPIKAKGKPNAAFSVVTMQPTLVDSEMGELLCGEDGELLKKMLTAIEIPFEKVYATSIVKNSELNDKIFLAEKNQHLELTFRELSFIGSNTVILLGEKCAQLFLKTGKSIKDLHQKQHKLPSTNPVKCKQIFVLEHPAKLINSQNLKKEAWEDLQWIQKHI